MSSDYTDITKLASPQRILQEQIKECCQPHYEIFFSAVLAIGFVGYIVFDVVDKQYLFVWIVCTTAILAARFAFIVWFNRLPKNQIHAKHIHVFTLIMFVWGIAWANGSLLFFPLISTLEQAAWFAMFMVMVAASATSHAVYIYAFYAFAIPYFLGMLWMVATQFPSPYHVNAFIYILVMVTQIGAAKKGQKMILESLRLRFENIELIEDLKAQRDAADKANHSKSKFLAAASHDLRQPLHALTLFNAALKECLNEPVKANQMLDKIDSSVVALQSLFNALLDISRLDAGTLICKKEHFDSQLILNKLHNDFTPIAAEKGLTLQIETRSIALYSDATLLELILRNILSNAIRYTNEGNVKLSMIPKGTQTCIEIIDSGIGFDAQQKSLIFEEFVQLDNPERDRNKGLGLGLAIVKRVAMLLEADLYVDSIVDSGSTFSICVDAGDPSKITKQEAYLVDKHVDSSGLIIVIDDERSNLEAMDALVSAWGYQLILATDVNQALEKLEKDKSTPDCIIADYRLRQKQTGVEAISRLRDIFGQNLPALIVSGDIAKDRLTNVKANNLDILHKPVQPAKLRSFLHKQINLKRTRSITG